MDRYSRWVAFLKVLLPLAALALLSTLFLLSRGVDPDAAIPFAQSEVLDRTRGQLVTAPYYSGVTRSGNEVLITASTARPGIGGKPGRASYLRARIKTPEGTVVELAAAEGTLSLEGDSALFEGDVHIQTSAGYDLHTERLETQMDPVLAEAPGKVQGSGPAGQIVADSMVIRAEKEGDPLHILFNGGVRLIYDPKGSSR